MLPIPTYSRKKPIRSLVIDMIDFYSAFQLVLVILLGRFLNAIFEKALSTPSDIAIIGVTAIAGALLSFPITSFLRNRNVFHIKYDKKQIISSVSHEKEKSKIL